MNLLNDKFARVVTDVSSKADFTTTADIYKMVHATAQQKSLTSAAYAQRTGAALLTDGRAASSVKRAAPVLWAYTT
jgi:hypothetical protein